MAVTGLDLAKKRATTFLEFSYGSTPTYVRYTDEDEDATFEGNTYSAEPTLLVKLAEQTGFLDEEMSTIILPLDSFTELLSNGQPFPRVSIRIVCVLESDTPGSPADQVLELFKGAVTLSIRNYQKRPGRVGLRCSTWKLESAKACGIPATKECAWQFQGYGCVVPDGLGGYVSTITPASPATVAATVASINQGLLTVSALPGTPYSDDVFHRGFLEYDALRLGIRKWSKALPLEFHLERAAPDFWVGKSVTVHYGCDKSLDTCVNRYNNDTWFGGMGIRIPDYHPILDVRE